jgi:hypothetical protein
MFFFGYVSVPLECFRVFGWDWKIGSTAPGTHREREGGEGRRGGLVVVLQLQG